MESQSETVSKDAGANKVFAVYLSVLGIVGVVLIVLTVVYGWGFWGYFGGGILALAGFGGLISMLATGGMGKLNCPACGAELEVMHISIHRYLECKNCGRWLEGAQTMNLVAQDHVADYPVFKTPMPKEEIVWPEGCPVCSRPATRTVKLEWDLSSVNLAVVKVTKVRTIEAPCCDEHKDGVALDGYGETATIGFRSYSYMEKFRELNGL